MKRTEGTMSRTDDGFDPLVARRNLQDQRLDPMEVAGGEEICKTMTKYARSPFLSSDWFL